MSGGGGSGIRGYWYFLGLHMGIGRGPINSVVEMRVGDKTLLNIEIGTDAVFPIYRPDLFGGEDAEGGVGGACYVMMGGPTQEAPEALRTMIGGGFFPAVLPGFRRMATIFFDGFIAAINPYPKPWKFRVRRTTAGWDGEPWYPEKCLIELTRVWTLAEITSSPMIHAMNPAHIFYEVMTNREWGRGLPRSAMDDANLRAVADALHAEGFGLCLRWTRSDSIETFVQSILDHIGAVMRPNISTGELQLKLLRDDYVFEDLPLFTNETGLLDITEASVAATPTIINHVRVNFNDPITGKAASVGTHNLAGVQGSDGEINTQVKDYPGVCTPDLAARVALRDLRLSSNSLRRFTLTLDRRGADVRPGDVIRIQDPTRMIPDMAVRVGRFEDGPMTDGRIRLTAVQDVFSLSAASYIGNQPPAWEAPNATPCIGYNRSFEMPYFMLARMMSKADLDYLDDDEGRLGEVVELGGRPLNSGYRLAVRNGAPTEDDIPDAETDYCPTVPAHWDGGDCVKIVTEGGAELLFNLVIGEYPVYPEEARGFSIAGWGSANGPDAARPYQFLMNDVSEHFGSASSALLFRGTEEEAWETVDWTYAGVTYTYALTYYPPGVIAPDSGIWAGGSPTLVFWPDVGSTVAMKVNGQAGIRIVEACCVCLEIRMTGVPVLNPAFPPENNNYALNGVVTAPSSLSPVATTPRWGPAFTKLNDDGVTYTYSDNTLGVYLSPKDSPFLTDVVTCKVYDDSDGGALVYETALYRANDPSEAYPFAVYAERFISDVLDVPASSYPYLHDTPPPNPAVALAGHNLRFVLNTASACCGGLPPEPPTYGAMLRQFGTTGGSGTVAEARVGDEVFPYTAGRDYVSDYSGPRVMYLAMAGVLFYLIALDADGNILPAEQQPTDWVAEVIDGEAATTVYSAATLESLAGSLAPAYVPGVAGLAVQAAMVTGATIRYSSPSLSGCTGVIRVQMAKQELRVMPRAEQPPFRFVTDYIPDPVTGACINTSSAFYRSETRVASEGTYPVSLSGTDVMQAKPLFLEVGGRSSGEEGDFTLAFNLAPVDGTPWLMIGTDPDTGVYYGEALAAQLNALVLPTDLPIGSLYCPQGNGSGTGYEGLVGISMVQAQTPRTSVTSYLGSDAFDPASTTFDGRSYETMVLSPIMTDAKVADLMSKYEYGPRIGNHRRGDGCEPPNDLNVRNLLNSPPVLLERRVEPPILD